MGALRDFFKALLPHQHDYHPTILGMEQCSICAKCRVMLTTPKPPLSDCVRNTMNVEWRKRDDESTSK